MPLKTTVTPPKILDPYEEDRNHAFIMFVAFMIGMGVVTLVLHANLK